MRAQTIFMDAYKGLARKIDKIFACLFVGQWILGIVFALFVSPKTWAGAYSQTHIHVYAAVFLGGILASLPVYLIWRQPGAELNRFVVCVAQMLFSILFIHLTGGRIETHFHIFGSIAFIAFYRDWRLVVLATLITGADHVLRGFFWPESVYGVLSATPWRALEHAAWVAFEDIVLLFAVRDGVDLLWSMAEREVELIDAVLETQRVNALAETYRYALDTFAIVAITDLKGAITSANDNFCQISGYEREELLGRNHRIVNSGLHAREFFQGMWHTIAAGNVWEGEIQNRAKDGTQYWVDTTIVPVKSASGKVKEYLAVRKDISERKRLEASLEALNHSLERQVEERTQKWVDAEQKLTHASKMSALGEMAGGVAHEINNPLAVIKTVSSQLAEVLAESPVDTKLAASMSESICRTTDRIAKIVQGLRSFSREGGQDPFQEVSARDLVNDTTSFCSERFRNHGVELITESIPDSLKFEGRSTQISQVLLNLLNNAFDAIQNLPKKWISIAVKSEGGWMEIRITDSGSGISEDTRRKIFEPFFTTKGVGKGTGMGLSISLGIAQVHGGVLTLDSGNPNTSFVLRIPVSQAKREASKAS